MSTSRQSRVWVQELEAWGCRKAEANACQEVRPWQVKSSSPPTPPSMIRSTRPSRTLNSHHTVMFLGRISWVHTPLTSTPVDVTYMVWTENLQLACSSHCYSQQSHLTACFSHHAPENRALLSSLQTTYLVSFSLTFFKLHNPCLSLHCVGSSDSSLSSWF